MKAPLLLAGLTFTAIAGDMHDFNYQPSKGQTNVTIQAASRVSDVEIEISGQKLVETKVVDKGERLSAYYGVTDSVAIGLHGTSLRSTTEITDDDYDLFSDSSLGQGENFGVSVSHLHNLDKFSIMSAFSHQIAANYEESKASEDFGTTSLSFSGVYSQDGFQGQLKIAFDSFGKGKYTQQYGAVTTDLNFQYTFGRFTPFLGGSSSSIDEREFNSGGYKETTESVVIGKSTLGFKVLIVDDVLLTLYRERVAGADLEIEAGGIDFDQEINSTTTGLKVGFQF